MKTFQRRRSVHSEKIIPPAGCVRAETYAPPCHSERSEESLAPQAAESVRPEIPRVARNDTREQVAEQRGQSLVEMALMMVILLTILSAVLDLGRGFFMFIAIQNSAAEGALYAAMNPTCGHSGDPGLNGAICADPNNIDYRAKHESSDGLVDSTRMTVSVLYSNGTSHYSKENIVEGNPITVTIGYSFTMVGPFSGVFPKGQLMFEAHAMQNILDLKQ